MAGGTNSRTEARFVVLRHVDRLGVHFDLMIDVGDGLATWKMSAPPEAANKVGIICRRIGDHRRAYLEYEGPISGDRGEVSRHDCGSCFCHEKTDDAWIVEFRGRLLMGWYKLERCRPDDQDWLLRFVRR